jgi:hypothetical protein
MKLHETALSVRDGFSRLVFLHRQKAGPINQLGRRGAAKINPLLFSVKLRPPRGWDSSHTPFVNAGGRLNTRLRGR